MHCYINDNILRTNTKDVLVSEIVAIVKKTVCSERHYQDAKAEICHAKAVIRSKKRNKSKRVSQRKMNRPNE